MGFLDPPPPLPQHVFSTKNTSPPTSANVIYEWSLGNALLSSLKNTFSFESTKNISSCCKLLQKSKPSRSFLADNLTQTLLNVKQFLILKVFYYSRYSRMSKRGLSYS